MNGYVNVDTIKYLIDINTIPIDDVVEIKHGEWVPITDVVEVKHGEWIPIDIGDCCYRCSKCDFVRDANLLEEDTYCPHCGARMDGER